MHYGISALSGLSMRPWEPCKRAKGKTVVWRYVTNYKLHVYVSRSYCKANTPARVMALVSIDFCDRENDRGIVHGKWRKNKTKKNTFKSSLTFIEVIEGGGKLKMAKSLPLNAVEIDALFFLTHTLYIANTVSSLLFPSFEPQTGFSHW